MVYRADASLNMCLPDLLGWPPRPFHSRLRRDRNSRFSWLDKLLGVFRINFLDDTVLKRMVRKRGLQKHTAHFAESPVRIRGAPLASGLFIV